MGYRSISTLFSGLGSYRLPFISVFVKPSARGKIRRRERSHSSPPQLLWPKVPGLLRTRILSLSERWQHVIDSDEAYIVES